MEFCVEKYISVNVSGLFCLFVGLFVCFFLPFLHLPFSLLKLY